MFYSANWQLLEERIDTSSPFPHGVTSGSDAADIDKHQQYVWGPRTGGIDDLVLDRLDANKNGTFTDASDKNYFHCTDAQFTTVAVIDRFANVIERRSPDEYGRMRLCAREDVDGDGDVDTTDKTIAQNNTGSVPAPGDVDGDGDVDATDVSIINAKIGTNYRYGQLTTTDSVIGWDGYVFNSEIDGGGMYTVRYRHYRPDLGRWLERDPIGANGGINLYGYA